MPYAGCAKVFGDPLSDDVRDRANPNCQCNTAAAAVICGTGHLARVSLPANLRGSALLSLAAQPGRGHYSGATRGPSIMNAAQLMTEEQLGESIRELCSLLGWRFLWLRHLQHSSDGILDLLLIPLRDLDRRHILHRELKGYQASGRLGSLTPRQSETIQEINAAGGDARKWTPDDWFAGTIEEELR